MIIIRQMKGIKKMDIRILKYFIAVVEEKNITKAAQNLFISQPALSKQLKDLESELNIKLFHRGSRNIKLTEDGIFLYEQAKEIISLLDKTVSNIHMQKEIIGKIFIGAAETKAMETITPTIKSLISKHKNITFDFFSGNADEITEKLNNGLIDFGIIIEPIYKKNFEHLSLPFEETWGLLTTKNGIFSKKNSIAPNDLKNIPLITSKQSFHDQILSDWLNSNISNFNIIATFNLLYNASKLVENKIGHAVCIDGIINTVNKNLKFIPFEPPLKSNVSLIWKKNVKLSRAAEKFLKLLQENYTQT